MVLLRIRLWKTFLEKHDCKSKIALSPLMILIRRSRPFKENISSFCCSNLINKQSSEFEENSLQERWTARQAQEWPRWNKFEFRGKLQPIFQIVQRAKSHFSSFVNSSQLTTFPARRVLRSGNKSGEQLEFERDWTLTNTFFLSWNPDALSKPGNSRCKLLYNLAVSPMSTLTDLRWVTDGESFLKSFKIPFLGGVNICNISDLFRLHQPSWGVWDSWVQSRWRSFGNKIDLFDQMYLL